MEVPIHRHSAELVLCEFPAVCKQCAANRFSHVELAAGHSLWQLGPIVRAFVLLGLFFNAVKGIKVVYFSHLPTYSKM